MTRHIYIIFLLSFGLCCCVGKTSNQTKIAPDFKSDYELDTTIKFQYIRDAAYGYTFSRPMTFIEQIDTIGQVDSIVYFSKEKDAKLIYFVEGDIHRQDTSKNYLYEYFHKLETGQQPILKNCKTLKSQLRYDNKWLNYRGYFVAHTTHTTTTTLFPLFAKMIPPFDQAFEQYAKDLKKEAEAISKTK